MALTHQREETEIRAQIDAYTAALRAKRVDDVVSHYASDAVTADLAPPLWNRGADTLRRKFEDWFRSWIGAIGIEMRNVHVTASGDVAFARMLNRIHGMRTDGTATDVWVRATVCFRKIDGEWKVAHEHVSVPFYMDGSFRAAVDLKP
jgi:ketosteroid isomerase-like protein